MLVYNEFQDKCLFTIHLGIHQKGRQKTTKPIELVACVDMTRVLILGHELLDQWACLGWLCVSQGKCLARINWHGTLEGGVVVLVDALKSDVSAFLSSEDWPNLLHYLAAEQTFDWRTYQDYDDLLVCIKRKSSLSLLLVSCLNFADFTPGLFEQYLHKGRRSTRIADQNVGVLRNRLLV